MPLLNYTTTIDAQKTVSEITKILAKHGARQILMNYDGDGYIEALSFIISLPNGNIPFRLPVDPDAVLSVMKAQNIRPSYCNRPHAIRVAWRIIKDWVEAQIALLETEQVKLAQLFLSYMIIDDKHTLFEAMEKKNFYLPEGKPEK